MKKYTDLQTLLGKTPSAFKKFHAISKSKKSVPPDPEKWPKEWSTTYFKEYPRLEKIVLPKPDLSDKISLKEVLFKRKSIRSFEKSAISLEQISTLLYYSAGCKTYSHPWRANRFHPSGGSRYPLEMYMISLQSELGKGIFHYNIRSHTLEVLSQYQKIDFSKYFNHEWSGGEAIIVIFTACFFRTTMKYRDRGYRYILSETGNLSQNFYLVSTALNIGCTVIGYVDDKVNTLLDIDGSDESVVYAMVFGMKKQT